MSSNPAQRVLKVAILLSGEEGYGVGRFLQTQYEQSRQYAMEMTYFYVNEGSLIRELRALGAPLVQLSCPAWKIDARAVTQSYLRWMFSRDGVKRMTRETATAVRDLGCGLLYSHSLPAHLTNGPAARRAGVPAVGQYHGVLSRARFYGLSRLALSWLLASSLDRILCISEFARATFLWPATRKLRRIYNGTDCETIEAQVRGARKIPRLCVCVGRLHTIKRVEVAIRAMGLLKSRGVRCALELIGGPNEDSNPYFCTLRGLVDELGLADCVRFAGVLSPPYTRMAEAEIFIHCTGKESFGLATVEAMSCGLAVVVPNTGGTAEVVEHDRNGLTYPTGDSAALADAVQRLLQDDALRSKLAEAGRHRARECFGIAAHMTAVRAAFDEVLAERGL